eukprot:GGOE01005555.1.p2 GENE.GGOE01005555.1~~GGOE01005555.1.p2  ORF type:complete len:203 (+),score=13.07 GGOE01005555.1:231-839(+)
MRHNRGETQVMSDDDEPAVAGDHRPAAMACPFPECPDSHTNRARKALVSHLAARHVSHGQVVPAGFLQLLRVSVCCPCNTLVPTGTRCRNCHTTPNSSDPPEPAQAPVPLVPPRADAPLQPGTPTTSPCPPLVPSFGEVLATQVPTVRHIPAMCRTAVSLELAQLVREIAVPVPTWEALHRLMCFPKLVLRSSGRGGCKHQR